MATTTREMNQTAVRVRDERGARIAEARAKLEAARKGMEDAQQAANQLMRERDRLNAGQPADSPAGFVARWERLVVLDGAIGNARAWQVYWQPKVSQAEQDFREAVTVQPAAFDLAAQDELSPLLDEVERLRTSPYRARPEVERQYQTALDRYDAARARWASVWNQEAGR